LDLSNNPQMMIAQGKIEHLEKVVTDTESYINSAPESMLQSMNRFATLRDEKDINGNFLIVEKRRKDGTLFMKSVLSQLDSNGNPTIRTVTSYQDDGLTIIDSPLIFDVFYDEEGDFIREVPR